MFPLEETRECCQGARTAPFSLSSVITPTALLRARRCVDLFSSPRLFDASLKASHDKELEAFIEVVTVLRRAEQAHTTAERERLSALDATEATHSIGNGAIEAPSSSSSPPCDSAVVRPAREGMVRHEFSPLRALREAFGDTRGSALHRAWLEVPRAHLSAVTKLISQSVLLRYVRRFWPVQENGATTPALLAALYARTYDVHVQWQPSRNNSRSDAAPVSVVGHNVGAEGAVAVVIVRRREAVARLVAEEARLAARYLAVAAEGQTVESSLRFWGDVSYDDRPRGEEAAFEPLGFDRASRLAQARWHPTPAREETEVNRVHGGTTAAASRKRPRESLPTSTSTEDSADSAAPVVVLGSTTCLDAPSLAEQPHGSPSMWRQPSALLVAPKVTATRASGSPAASSACPPSPSRVRHSRVGLVAVLYVSIQGVVYVGFAEGATGPALLDDPTAKAAATPPVASPAPATAPSMLLPVLTHALLPLESSDSFTRGLLRL